MAVRDRSKSVDAGTFLAAVLAGNEAGKTNAQVAAEIGMKEKSFSVRLSKTRTAIEKDEMVKDVDAEGNKIPFTAEEKKALYAALELKRSGNGGRPAASPAVLGNLVKDKFAALLNKKD